MSWMRSIVLWFDARRRSIALLLGGWIAVVVVAAGRGSDDSQWVVVPDLSWLLAGALGVIALVRIVTLVLLRPRLQGMGGERRQLSLRRILTLSVFLLAAAIVFDGQQVLEETAEEPIVEQPASGARIDDAADTGFGLVDTRGDMAALLLLVAAATGILVWSRSRPATPRVLADPVDQPLEPQLSSAVDVATDFLLQGDDPRAAVMVAYATLERALASTGRARVQSETTTEHLARALHGVPSLVEPAVQLGHLYELARFSDTTITADDQQQAANALVESRQHVSTMDQRSTMDPISTMDQVS